METKYHVSADGKLRVCTAVYSCRLDGDHYTKAEVRVQKQVY
jgi:hypothetical protein